MRKGHGMESSQLELQHTHEIKERRTDRLRENSRERLIPLYFSHVPFVLNAHKNFTGKVSNGPYV